MIKIRHQIKILFLDLVNMCVVPVTYRKALTYTGKGSHSQVAEDRILCRAKRY